MLVIIIDLLLAITDIRLSYRLATSPLGPGMLCIVRVFLLSYMNTRHRVQVAQMLRKCCDNARNSWLSSAVISSFVYEPKQKSNSLCHVQVHGHFSHGSSQYDTF
jgi:hypothetical protein